MSPHSSTQGLPLVGKLSFAKGKTPRCTCKLYYTASHSSGEEKRSPLVVHKVHFLPRLLFLIFQFFKSAPGGGFAVFDFVPAWMHALPVKNSLHPIERKAHSLPYWFSIPPPLKIPPILLWGIASQKLRPWKNFFQKVPGVWMDTNKEKPCQPFWPVTISAKYPLPNTPKNLIARFPPGS